MAACAKNSIKDTYSQLLQHGQSDMTAFLSTLNDRAVWQPKDRDHFKKIKFSNFKRSEDNIYPKR
jgi:hypothetical protein